MKLLHTCCECCEHAARVIAPLQESNDELEATFDLRWKADMRAIKRWQAAGEGREKTWPDHADLCVWLLEQLEAKEAPVGNE